MTRTRYSVAISVLVVSLAGFFAIDLAVGQYEEPKGYQPHVIRRGPADSGSMGSALEVRELSGSSQPKALEASSKSRHLDGSAKPQAKKASSQSYALAPSSVSQAKGSYIQPKNYGYGAKVSATSFRQLGCTPKTRNVRGQTYHVCAQTWYRRSYERGEVVYKAVSPPEGA